MRPVVWLIKAAFLCWRKQCFCCCYGLVALSSWVLFYFEREREPAPVCSVCHHTWLCVFNYLNYIYLFVNFFRHYIWVIFFHLPYTLVYSPTPPYVPNFSSLSLVWNTRISWVKVHPRKFLTIPFKESPT